MQTRELLRDCRTPGMTRASSIPKKPSGGRHAAPDGLIYGFRVFPSPVASLCSEWVPSAVFLLLLLPTGRVPPSLASFPSSAYRSRAVSTVFYGGEHLESCYPVCWIYAVKSTARKSLD